KTFKHTLPLYWPDFVITFYFTGTGSILKCFSLNNFTFLCIAAQIPGLLCNILFASSSGVFCP
ncbi:MAG: hypothetical protein ACTS8W_00135, partial [Arsenophonus sp. NC-PY1-MAG3]